MTRSRFPITTSTVVTPGECRLRFTLTYGLGWTLEMPPTEATGKQVAFVGPDGTAIGTEQYLNAREQAALQGQVYNPTVGFALLGNVSNHPSYIYNPYYGEWSPRLAGAWDVFGDGRTVIRGGYGLTYGRLNGVDLVLVPLLGHRPDSGGAVHECSVERHLRPPDANPATCVPRPDGRTGCTVAAGNTDPAPAVCIPA